MRVEILDRDTHELVDTCTGPDDFGACPEHQSDATVPCAGQVVQTLPRGNDPGVRLNVRDTADVCPLRAFELLHF